jgi:hypothetical protein
VVVVSASQPRDHEFEPYSGHGHVTSYDTSTGWFHEADSKVFNISCKNFFRNRAYINMFKPIELLPLIKICTSYLTGVFENDVRMVVLIK